MDTQTGSVRWGNWTYAAEGPGANIGSMSIFRRNLA